MRQVILLLLLTLFPLNLLCQQDKEMLLDSTISYYWDSDTSEFVPGERYNYTYDSSGNLSVQLHAYWDQDTCDWIPSVIRGWHGWIIGGARIEYHYNAKGNLIEKIDYVWDSETKEWNYSMKLLAYWSKSDAFIPDDSVDDSIIVYPNPFIDFATIYLSDDIYVKKVIIQ